jgi:hypothetical protein
VTARYGDSHLRKTVTMPQHSPPGSEWGRASRQFLDCSARLVAIL